MRKGMRLSSIHLASALLGLSAVAACSDSAVQVGTTTVGTYTFDISREGDAPGPGVKTRAVVKPTAGGDPTSIMGWVGLADEDDADKVTGVFDSNDGDFDCNLTIPSPEPAGSMFFFDVDTNGTILTGSVAAT